MSATLTNRIFATTAGGTATNNSLTTNMTVVWYVADTGNNGVRTYGLTPGNVLGGDDIILWQDFGDGQAAGNRSGQFERSGLWIPDNMGFEGSPIYVYVWKVAVPTNATPGGNFFNQSDVQNGMTFGVLSLGVRPPPGWPNPGSGNSDLSILTPIFADQFCVGVVSCTITPTYPVCPATNTVYTSTLGLTGGTVTHSWSIAGNGTIVGGTAGASVTVLSGGAGPSYTLTDNITRDGCPGSCQLTVPVTNACLPLITVLNNSDHGAASLRQAILDVSPDGTIDFTNTLAGTTIALTSGELVINQNVTIIAPGTNGLTVSGNNTSSVFHITAGQVNLSGLTITGGNASSEGGGIYNQATLTVSNCTIIGNASPVYGGGIANEENLTIISSTICSNHAGSSGGGIYNAANLFLILSTVCNNSAAQYGGGIMNDLTAMSATNSTIAGNTAASDGGGIYSSGGLGCDLVSTIVAGNAASSAPDVRGASFSRGFNLIGVTNGNSGAGWQASDLLGSTNAPLDPLLGPLQGNGGPTLTMALLPASPAVDAGDDSVTNTYSTDQRGAGFLRLRGQHVDIGAYELDTTAYFAPTIASQSAGSITLNPTTRLGSLNISATVNPNGFVTTAWLQYGVWMGYGNLTAPLSLGHGTTIAPVNWPLTGLAPGLTWHYRVVAASAVGTTFGPDQTVNISPTGDLDGDGIVSAAELQSVFSNYWHNTALGLTNVALVDGTNFQFWVSNLTSLNLNVEVSTNLSTWEPLAPAQLFYQVTDPAATNTARAYRLGTP